MPQTHWIEAKVCPLKMKLTTWFQLSNQFDSWLCNAKDSSVACKQKNANEGFSYCNVTTSCCGCQLHITVDNFFPVYSRWLAIDAVLIPLQGNHQCRTEIACSLSSSERLTCSWSTVVNYTYHSIGIAFIASTETGILETCRESP